MAGIFSLRSFVEVFFRRKSTLIIPVFLVPVLTVLLSYLVPDQYMSTTTILINRSGILNPLVRFETAVSMQKWDELATLRKIIYSRPLIEHVIKELELEPPDTSRREHEWLIDDIRSSIHILSQEADSFQIGCTAPDPGTAQQLAEKVSEYFIERTLEGSQREANAAVEFIQNQLSDYRAELEVAEEKLKTFRLAHLDAIEQSRTIQEDLSRFENDAMQTRMKLREARFERDLLRKRLEDEEPMVIAETLYSEDTPYQRRYRELRLERANLLSSRVANHPAVQKLEREMESIRTLLEEERREGPAKQKREIQSPAYQKTKAQLQETELTVATLEHELEDYEKEVARLKVQRAEIPDVQNKYERLKNDAETLQKTCDSLDAKLQQARISRAVEMEQQTNRFSIINPPLVPLNRYRPIRKLYAIAGIAAGILLGTALIVGLEIVDPRVCRLDEINALASAPLWGVIPWLHPRRKRRMVWRIPLLSHLLRLAQRVVGRHRVFLPPSVSDPRRLGMHCVSGKSEPSGSTTGEGASGAAMQAFSRIVGVLRDVHEQTLAPVAVGVTSSRREEGRTTLATNLAAVLAAECRQSVLLVDADTRTPSLSQAFALSDAPGFTAALSGEQPLSELTRPSGVSGLELLPAGGTFDEIGQLSGMHRFPELVEKMKQQYAFVVFDLPPVLQSTQAKRGCDLADVNLLVARLYVSPRNVVKAAAHALPDTSANAVVANGREFWIPDWVLRWI